MDKLKIWVDFNPDIVNTSWMRSLLTGCGHYEYYERRIPDHEEAIRFAEGMDIVVNTYHMFDADDVKRMADSGVRFLMRYGTGYENIDVAAATSLGLPFANTPGANASTVAEMALLHILNCQRNFIRSYRAFAQNRKWPGDFSGYEIDGKTIGLMGFGNIAKQLVRLLSGFDAKIIAYDPYLTDSSMDYASAHDVEIVSRPEDLFMTADIISIHMPLNADTAKSVNKSLFDIAKPGVAIVNTSRGGVIDEDALSQALESGQVRVAGLDVMAQEPPEECNPLLGMENVFITSHTAGSSQEAEMRTQQLLFRTVEEFRNGNLPWNVINRNEILRGKEA